MGAWTLKRTTRKPWMTTLDLRAPWGLMRYLQDTCPSWLRVDDQKATELDPSSQLGRAWYCPHAHDNVHWPLVERGLDRQECVTLQSREYSFSCLVSPSFRQKGTNKAYAEVEQVFTLLRNPAWFSYCVIRNTRAGSHVPLLIQNQIKALKHNDNI